MPGVQGAQVQVVQGVVVPQCAPHVVSLQQQEGVVLPPQPGSGMMAQMVVVPALPQQRAF